MSYLLYSLNDNVIDLDVLKETKDQPISVVNVFDTKEEAINEQNKLAEIDANIHDVFARKDLKLRETANSYTKYLEARYILSKEEFKNYTGQTFIIELSVSR